MRIDSWPSTTLAGGPTQPLASGDKIAIRIVGSVITALHYTSGGGWVQVLSYDTGSDATRYTAAGRIALEFRTSTARRPRRRHARGAASAPANQSAPTMSGSTVSGQVLTASPGTWTGSPTPTFTYQWLRCDSSGANLPPDRRRHHPDLHPHRRPTSAPPAGRRHRNQHRRHRRPRQLSATAVVTAAQRAAAESVRPDGLGVDGVGPSADRLTGNMDGIADTDVHVSVAALRQQRRQLCLPIAGATPRPTRSPPTDVGSTLRIAVTATNTAGTTGPVQSAATAVVTAGGGVGPTTPVLDDFNRANGPAGGNWSLLRPTGIAAMNVSNNAAVDSSTSAFAWNYWNPSTFGPDCEAYVTIAVYGASDTIRIGARIVNAGTTTASGYYVSVSSTGAWSIIRIDSGPSTTLASGPTQPLAAGDKIAIRIVGTLITALHYTSGGGWAQVLTYDTSSDTTRYTAAGQIALEFKTSTLDDLGGGSI